MHQKKKVEYLTTFSTFSVLFPDSKDRITIQIFTETKLNRFIWIPFNVMSLPNPIALHRCEPKAAVAPNAAFQPTLPYLTNLKKNQL